MHNASLHLIGLSVSLKLYLQLQQADFFFINSNNSVLFRDSFIPNNDTDD